MSNASVLLVDAPDKWPVIMQQRNTPQYAFFDMAHTFELSLGKPNFVSRKWSAHIEYKRAFAIKMWFTNGTHYFCTSVRALRLFTQPFIQTQIKENIKAPCHWPLWPVNSQRKWPVTRKMFPFDDVMLFENDVCKRSAIQPGLNLDLVYRSMDMRADTICGW